MRETPRRENSRRTRICLQGIKKQVYCEKTLAGPRKAPARKNGEQLWKNCQSLNNSRIVYERFFTSQKNKMSMNGLACERCFETLHEKDPALARGGR